MRAWLVLALFLCGCAHTKWERPTTAETVALVVAHTAIAADVAQTLEFRSRGVGEWNPILGTYPSNAKVVVVGGLLPMAALTLLWLALPPKWRFLPPAYVFGMETYVVVDSQIRR